MPFENTPDEAETGTFEDSLANTDETTEEWVEHRGKHYGFILIPKEEVPWKIKSEAVQDSIGQTGLDAVDYYKTMLRYQVQETSFGAEERFDAWITGVSSGLLEKLEPFVPEPQGDAGRNLRADAALDLLDEFVERNGDPESVEAFRAFLKQRAEGDEGKSPAP
jgi:hypothetical protein